MMVHITSVQTESFAHRGALETRLPAGDVPFFEDIPPEDEVGDDGIGGVPIKAVEVCYRHAIACSSNGMCYTWGQGTDGILGTDMEATPIPVPVQALFRERIKQVAVGRSHSLALTYNGDVYGWGSDFHGQVGVKGFTTSKSSNILVPSRLTIRSQSDRQPPQPVMMISAGAAHSAAVTARGRLYTWGLNTAGQLGTVTGGGDMASVQPTDRPKGCPPLLWAGVACGEKHTVAWTREGGAWSWGQDHLGGVIYTPCPVTALYRVRVARMAAGGGVTLAVTDQGLVYAWGRLQGQNHAEHSIRGVRPVIALMDHRAVGASAGTQYAAVLLGNGRARLWSEHAGHPAQLRAPVDRQNVKAVSVGDQVAVLTPLDAFPAAARRAVRRALGAGLGEEPSLAGKLGRALGLGGGDGGTGFTQRGSSRRGLLSLRESLRLPGSVVRRGGGGGGGVGGSAEGEGEEKGEGGEEEGAEDPDALLFPRDLRPAGEDGGGGEGDDPVVSKASSKSSSRRSFEKEEFVQLERAHSKQADIDGWPQEEGAVAEDGGGGGDWDDGQTMAAAGGAYAETSLPEHLAALLWGGGRAADVVVLMRPHPKAPDAGGALRHPAHAFLLRARAPALLEAARGRWRPHAAAAAKGDPEASSQPQHVLDLSDFSGAAVLLYLNYLYTGQSPELGMMQKNLSSEYQALQDGKVGALGSNKRFSQRRMFGSSREEESKRNADCSICLEPMYTSNVVELSRCQVCSNEFHTDCIQNWRNWQGQGSDRDYCPICKQKGTFLTQSQAARAAAAALPKPQNVYAHLRAQLELGVSSLLGRPAAADAADGGGGNLLALAAADGSGLPGCHEALLLRYPLFHKFVMKYVEKLPSDSSKVTATIPLKENHARALLHYLYGRTPDEVLRWVSSSSSTTPGGDGGGGGGGGGGNRLRDLLELAALACAFGMHDLQFTLETEAVLTLDRLMGEYPHVPLFRAANGHGGGGGGGGTREAPVVWAGGCMGCCTGPGPALDLGEETAALAEDNSNSSFSGSQSKAQAQLYRSAAAAALPALGPGARPRVRSLDFEWLGARALTAFMDVYRNALRAIHDEEGTGENTTLMTSQFFDQRIQTVGERLRVGLVTLLRKHIFPNNRFPSWVYGYPNSDLIKELLYPSDWRSKNW